MKTFLAVCVLLTAFLMVTPAEAGLGSQAAGELAEFLVKKFGKEVAKGGVKNLAGRLVAATAKHG